VFITAVPITKLFAGGEVDIGGHVLVVISGAFIFFLLHNHSVPVNPIPNPDPNQIQAPQMSLKET
jgi:hypothetical protein